VVRERERARRDINRWRERKRERVEDGGYREGMGVRVGVTVRISLLPGICLALPCHV
jgi:hypothetical protein